MTTKSVVHPLAPAKADGTDTPIGIDLALPKARYKELNMDCFRNPMIESCHCDSSIETRNVHDGVHVRSPSVQKMTQEPFNANRSDEVLLFGEDVLMLNVTPLFRGDS